MATSHSSFLIPHSSFAMARSPLPAPRSSPDPHLRLFLRRLALLVITYQLLRVRFHPWNWKAFAEAPARAIMGAYARSLVFDLSAILTPSLPWAAASLLLPPPLLDRPGVQRT